MDSVNEVARLLTEYGMSLRHPNLLVACVQSNAYLYQIDSIVKANEWMRPAVADLIKVWQER